MYFSAVSYMLTVALALPGLHALPQPSSGADVGSTTSDIEKRVPSGSVPAGPSVAEVAARAVDDTDADARFAKRAPMPPEVIMPGRKGTAITMAAELEKSRAALVILDVNKREAENEHEANTKANNERRPEPKMTYHFPILYHIYVKDDPPPALSLWITTLNNAARDVQQSMQAAGLSKNDVKVELVIPEDPPAAEAQTMQTFRNRVKSRMGAIVGEVEEKSYKEKAEVVVVAVENKVSIK